MKKRNRDLERNIKKYKLREKGKKESLKEIEEQN